MNSELFSFCHKIKKVIATFISQYVAIASSKHATVS